MRPRLVLTVLLLAATGAAAQRRRTLDDANFEHTTQAATGQTTGIWFVNFCSLTAKTCKALAAEWEELGKELLQHQPAPVFLTTVDVHSSPQLRQRFGVTTLPTLLLFRDRKMYRFSDRLVPGADVKGQLRRFALEEYAGAKAEAVPPPPTAFDWLVKGLQHKLAAVQQALEEQDMTKLAIALLPVLVVCLLGLLLMLASASRKKSKRD